MVGPMSIEDSNSTLILNMDFLNLNRYDHITSLMTLLIESDQSHFIQTKDICKILDTDHSITGIFTSKRVN